MKSHLQPRIPCAPSNVDVMAPEITPPKAPDCIPAAKKMMNRFDLLRISDISGLCRCGIGKRTAHSFDTM
jgi:hypothetical protein